MTPKFKGILLTNNHRKKYLHAFKRIAEYRNEIIKLEDKIISWLIHDKRVR